jgi:hypothetical protein
VTEHALPVGDAHELIHLGGETAVVIPLQEYQQMRKTADAARAGRFRSNDPEDFLAISGLTDEEKDLLRRKYGLAQA